MALATVAATACAATVGVLNTSTATRCAEEDNIAVALLNPAITGFTVEARPPGYPITVDSTAPDMENCNRGTRDPVFAFRDPQRFTLFSNAVTVIVAERYGSFWRSNVVTLKVGGAIAAGMHTMTLRRKIAGLAIWPECMVLYGSDGNIRLKPHPPLTLADNVFGQSVLVGPVTNELRPVVDISQIEYVPTLDDLILTYSQGGSATLHIQEISRSKLSLNVEVNAPLGPSQPFCMVRSMFVSSHNCDCEFGAVRLTSTNTWGASPVLQTASARAGEALFFRSSQPQAHNRSAPDLWFGGFLTRSRNPVSAIVGQRALTQRSSR